MTENGQIRRSRRQLLAGGAAAAGLAAASLARGVPAEAANGDALILGQMNQASSGTTINDSGGDAATFTAEATSAGIGLRGSSADGTGVAGYSTNGWGVSGASLDTAANAAAIYGELSVLAPGPFSAGVRGQNDGTGGNGIGVYGSHAGGGWGVYGTSQSGNGVYGTSSGVGVAGFGTTGVSGSGTTGVHGTATAGAGAGVLAENSHNGPALKVQGIAE